MSEPRRIETPLDDEQFLALALRYLDGATSSADEATMAAQLHARPNRCRQFVMLCRHAAMLRETFAVPAVEDDSPPSFPTIQYPLPAATPFIGGILFSYLAAALIVGVGLLLGAMTHVAQPVSVARQSVPLPSPASSLPSVVGRITGMVECRWKQGAGDAGRGTGANRDQSLIPSQEESRVIVISAFARRRQAD